MIYEVIIDISDVERRSFDFKRMFDESIPCKERIVRCRDCRHATISSFGRVKYCEMFVMPDVDGYGADPQVNLPLSFFCGYGELRGDAE